ncbi:MAG: hypothetical protein ABSF37_11500 [Sedimentisphaerales bacterium]
MVFPDFLSTASTAGTNDPVPPDVLSLSPGALPMKVRSRYKPSGRTRRHAIFMVIFFGLIGLGIGLLIVPVIGFIGQYPMRKYGFVASENIFYGLVFLAGFLWYFGAPLLISLIIGGCISAGITRAKCRNRVVAVVGTFLVSIITAPVIVNLMPMYLSIANFPASPVLGYIYATITVVISILLADYAVKENKFCENCERYMEEKTVEYYRIENLKDLLVALYCNQDLPQMVLPLTHEVGKPPNKKNSVKIVEFLCSCNEESLVEAYASVGQKTSYSKVTAGAILVFSGMVKKRVLSSFRVGSSAN